MGGLSFHGGIYPGVDRILTDAGGGFPGGPVIENLPANAEDKLDPGWGTKIPSEAGQLKLQSTTATEPECSTTRDAPSPPSAAAI